MTSHDSTLLHGVVYSNNYLSANTDSVPRVSVPALSVPLRLAFVTVLPLS